MAGNREYKSDVFSMLMEDKRNALQVYNAVNGSDYDDPEKVEICSLDRGISLTVRDDAAFVVDANLSIYEHQSTVQAITGAIDRCIEEGVLKEFLMEHRAEVVKMTQLDYTFERRIMLAKRDSREEGREEGIDDGELKHLILLISKKKTKYVPVSETADMLETDEALVQKVYDALETYDAETQWEDIIKLIK